MEKVYDDTHLLDRISSRNGHRAFRVIFERYYELLFSLAIRKTNSRDLALDLVQETFVNFWNYRHKVGGIRNTGAYLATMLKYQFLKNVDSEKIIFKNDEFLANSALTSDEDGFSILEFNELYALIESHIEKLPPKAREIFILNRFENKSVSELAVQFGVTESTIRNHLSQTQNRLSNELQGHMLGIALLASFSS